MLSGATMTSFAVPAVPGTGAETDEMYKAIGSVIDKANRYAVPASSDGDKKKKESLNVGLDPYSLARDTPLAVDGEVVEVMATPEVDTNNGATTVVACAAFLVLAFVGALL